MVRLRVNIVGIFIPTPIERKRLISLLKKHELTYTESTEGVKMVIKNVDLSSFRLDFVLRELQEIENKKFSVERIQEVENDVKKETENL